MALNNNLVEPEGVELAYIQCVWCSNDSNFKYFAIIINGK